PHLGLISFIIQLSSNSLTGTTPDEFDIFILDATLNRFGTGDPTRQNAVLRGFFGGTPNVTLFATPFGNTLTPVASVPEPSTCLLCGLGVGCLIVRRKWSSVASTARRLVAGLTSSQRRPDIEAKLNDHVTV